MDVLFRTCITILGKYLGFGKETPFDPTSVGYKKISIREIKLDGLTNSITVYSSLNQENFIKIKAFFIFFILFEIHFTPFPFILATDVI